MGISLYPPFEGKIEEFNNLLHAKKVPHHHLTSEMVTRNFFVNTSLKPHDNAKENFFSCNHTGCRNLWEGKLAHCYKSSAIKIFNNYFNQKLPEESGLIDLYDQTLTTEKLQAKLLEPFELCRYCTKSEWREWGRIKYPASINDWLPRTRGCW